MFKKIRNWLSSKLIVGELIKGEEELTTTDLAVQKTLEKKHYEKVAEAVVEKMQNKNKWTFNTKPPRKISEMPDRLYVYVVIGITFWNPLVLGVFYSEDTANLIIKNNNFRYNRLFYTKCKIDG